MIDKTMMGSMNKRSVNKGSTLRMPAKFSYMTEEEAEYDGNGCWAWVLTIFGGLSLLGGGVCFAAHFGWDIGDRKTMIIAGAALCAVGAVCLGFGIRGIRAGSVNPNLPSEPLTQPGTNPTGVPSEAPSDVKNS